MEIRRPIKEHPPRRTVPPHAPTASPQFAFLSREFHPREVHRWAAEKARREAIVRRVVDGGGFVTGFAPSGHSTGFRQSRISKRIADDIVDEVFILQQELSGCSPAGSCGFSSGGSSRDPRSRRGPSHRTGLVGLTSGSSGRWRPRRLYSPDVRGRSRVTDSDSFDCVGREPSSTVAAFPGLEAGK